MRTFIEVPAGRASRFLALAVALVVARALYRFKDTRSEIGKRKIQPARKYLQKLPQPGLHRVVVRAPRAQLLRDIATGRKNFHFAGSDDAARRPAALYSLRGVNTLIPHCWRPPPP